MFPRFAIIVSFAFLAAEAGGQILSPGAGKLIDLVPPPPADASPAGLADVETMLEIQADRTPEQLGRAKMVDHQSVFSFGRPALGEWFHSKNLPRTAAIFDRINRETGRLIDACKSQWKRPRPFVREPRILLVVNFPGNSSYPSGHSASAAIWAAVLGAAFPEDAAAFQKQLHEVMWCRVLGGVHFPSDTTAGKILGDAIGRDLLSQPETRKDLEIIREETAPFRTKKAA